ncbi:MAG: hypothetical protein ACRD0B_11050, partial [Acidimicrobiales bacterium]
MPALPTPVRPAPPSCSPAGSSPAATHGRPDAPEVVDRDLAASLWDRFFYERSTEDRNELLLAYEPLVSRVVARLPANVRNYWESDDLHGFGVLGLVEAIDRWKEGSEPERFAHYAMKRVRGAIFD